MHKMMKPHRQHGSEVGLYASEAVAGHTFTDAKAFLAAAGTPSFVETFEKLGPQNRALDKLSDGPIHFIPLASGLYIGPVGPHWVMGEGVPEPTSTVLFADSAQDSIMQFTQSVVAVGFDVYYNGLGPALTTFFHGDSVLDTIAYDGPAMIGYAGFVGSAAETVTSVRFTTTSAEVRNTAIDNVALVFDSDP